MWYSYHFMQFQYTPLINLPKNLRKRTETAKSAWKWSFFVGLSTLSCWPPSQSKLKSIGHATSCSTLSISCNSNISHSFTCLKTWAKGHKRLKILKKMIICHKFELSSRLISIGKQNKNLRALNHMSHSYHFMQF